MEDDSLLFMVPLTWFGEADGQEGGEEAAAAEGGDGGGGDGGDGERSKGPVDNGKDDFVSYGPQISPEQRNDKDIRKFLLANPKLTDLVKTAYGLHTKAGRSLVIPDKDNPDPAEVKALRETLDIPEKAEEYKLSTEAFKDLESAPAVEKVVRAFVGSASMTQSQAQKTLDFLLTLQKDARAAKAKADKEYRDSFKARLLEAFKGDQKKADEAENLYKRFAVMRIGDAGLLKRVADANLFHDALYAMKMAEVERHLGEAPFFDGERGRGKGQRQGRMGRYSPEFEERFGKGEEQG